MSIFDSLELTKLLKNLINNFHKQDLISGFLVFLIAMPLSLGIAVASGFPAIYGLITAMVGGILVSFFVGSALTIKGPAAGLIVIIASAVHDFGNGNAVLGWKLTLGTIFTAAVFQVVFARLKFGKFVDFFPISAVKGMLTAIGIIILSKQIFVLIGVKPINENGELLSKPIDLLVLFPQKIMQIEHPIFFLIGLLSLSILIIWQISNSNTLKKVPGALVVLILSCIIGLNFGKNTLQISEYDSFFLVVNQKVSDLFHFPISFEGIFQPKIFVKYSFIFLLVGSLETLLSVKAIDTLVNKGKSDFNKDLQAVGIGNMISSALGGLPMIAEVARSTANVNNGAKTQWANFYHGLFILIFLVLVGFLNESIPLSALAAMLIVVGWNLAKPAIFIQKWQKGKDQFVIFISTIIVSLLTDILMGICVGILVNISFHFFRGLKLRNVFQLNYQIFNDKVLVKDFLVFSNYLKLDEIITNPKVKTIDLTQCKFVDYSSKQNLLLKMKANNSENHQIQIIGLD